MDRACCVSRSRLCAAATPTQLITPLFISNNGRGWNKSEPRTLPASSTRKVQTGTLKRASGFKRYSLSFLMEKNRKWRREARLLIYTSPQSGGGEKRAGLPPCPHLWFASTRVIPLWCSLLLFSTAKIHLHFVRATLEKWVNSGRICFT